MNEPPDQTAELRAENFDRDFLARFEILGHVDQTHSAFSQLFFEAKAPYHFVDAGVCLGEEHG